MDSTSKDKTHRSLRAPKALCPYNSQRTSSERHAFLSPRRSKAISDLFEPARGFLSTERRSTPRSKATSKAIASVNVDRHPRFRVDRRRPASKATSKARAWNLKARRHRSKASSKARRRKRRRPRRPKDSVGVVEARRHSRARARTRRITRDARRRDR